MFVVLDPFYSVTQFNLPAFVFERCGTNKLAVFCLGIQIVYHLKGNIVWKTTGGVTDSKKYWCISAKATINLDLLSTCQDSGAFSENRFCKDVKFNLKQTVLFEQIQCLCGVWFVGFQKWYTDWRSLAYPGFIFPCSFFPSTCLVLLLIKNIVM